MAASNRVEIDEPAVAVDDATLCDLLAGMVRARRWSTRMFNLQRQGRMGTTAPIDGEEAAVVGSAAAMDPAVDWAVPQYREPVGLTRFGERVLLHTVLYHLGHPDACAYPPDVHVFPTQISIAAQIPHAVGLAWGMRLRGEPGATPVRLEAVRPPGSYAYEIAVYREITVPLTKDEDTDGANPRPPFTARIWAKERTIQADAPNADVALERGLGFFEIGCE